MSNTLGEKIRQLRVARGLTQQKLSRGIATPSMISQIESGKTKPSPYLLTELASRLEVPSEDLMYVIQEELSEPVRYRLAVTLLENGDRARSLPILMDLTEHSPMMQGKAALTLVEAFLKVNDYSSAKKWLHFAQVHMTEHPTSKRWVRFLELSGRLALGNNQGSLAEYYFRTAISHLSSETTGWNEGRLLYWIAQAKYHRGQRQEAEKQCNAALDALLKEESIHSGRTYYLGVTWHLLAKIQGAFAYCTQALISLDHARNDLKQVKASKELWETHFTAAAIFEHCGEMEQVKYTFTTADEQLGVDDERRAVLYVHWAEFAVRQGLWDEADKLLQDSALSDVKPAVVDSLSERVRFLQAEWLLHQGQHEQGITLLQQLIQKVAGSQHYKVEQRACQRLAQFYIEQEDWQQGLLWEENRANAIAREWQEKAK